MQFKEVIGLDDLKSRLVDSVESGRIAHAQIFCGESGCGGYPLALSYASYLFCSNRVDGDSCGVCPSCYKMSRMEHADCHFVFPVNDPKGDDKPTSDKYIGRWRDFVLGSGGYFSVKQWYEELKIENKQGLIRREDANELLHKMSLKSFEGGYKIVIFYLPETMRAEASNSLLKLIEEPPANTLFLFVCEDVHRLISTIKSRTQPILVPKLPAETISKRLVELGVSDADSIARSANGNWLRAIELTKSDQTNALYDIFVDLMRLCYASNYLGIFKWVDTIAPLGRESHKAFCEFSLDLLRNCYMKGVGMDDLSFVLPSQKGFVEKFAPYVNHLTIEPFVAEYELLLRDLGQNGNAKIVFTHFALMLCKIFAQSKKELGR